MVWAPVMWSGKFKGFRCEVTVGNDGTWGAWIYKGGNLTPRDRKLDCGSEIRARKACKRLVIKARKEER